MGCPGMTSSKPISLSTVTGSVAFQAPIASRWNAAQGAAS